MEGIPSTTYIKVLKAKAQAEGQNSVIVRQNCIYLPNESQGIGSVDSLESKHVKYDVLGSILDESSSDLSCKHILRNKSSDLMRIFVQESKNIALFSIGSKKVKKALFLKRHFFPQLAAELFAAITNISDIMLSSEVHVTDVRLTLQAFDIRDDEIYDLLKPSSNLSLSLSAEGMKVKGLHQQVIVDESSLLSYLLATCENRSSNIQLARTLDSSAVWNIELTQTDVDSRGFRTINKCNMLIIDLPVTDSIMNEPITSNAGIKGSQFTKNSLTAFTEKIHKMSIAMQSHNESSNCSTLMSYLNEVLGGDYFVVGMV